MCGILGVLPRYVLTADPASISGVVAALRSLPEAELPTASHLAEEVLRGLSEPGALHALAGDADARAEVARLLDTADEYADKAEAFLDADVALPEDDLEAAQRQLVALRDALWAIRYDRFAAIARIEAMGGTGEDALRTFISYLAIDSVLEGIDKLEVRGRDSAGVQVWVALDAADRQAVRALLEADVVDDDFRSGAVRVVDSGVVFVFKRAAILGALGDNVAVLRHAVTTDARLAAALRRGSASISVLAHTRWASVGRISEPNAHPVDSRLAADELPFVAAALNGDIDNHVQLRREHRVPIGEITTDAKLIPVLLARQLSAGAELPEALRNCTALFDGSMAIASQADPDRLALAVKGSGQCLYVGTAPWCLFVSSEVYGLVAWTDRFVRLDGSTSDGTCLVVLDRRGDEGVVAVESGGHTPALKERTAEITTRDVSRAGFEHYLAKEIAGAPNSVRKSLRGRITRGERHTVSLGPAAVPDWLRERLAAGSVRNLVFVGQGTAAVAGHGIAAVVEPMLRQLHVRSLPATELSAGTLPADLSDTIIVAVSQSGTTTDTNRAVDLVRARGAAVLAIVNRRDSDLVHKCDGVLYTSDGRDIEMAVASTKAFYSQVVTGILLGIQLAAAAGQLDSDDQHALLAEMLALPAHLESVLAKDEIVAAAAASTAPATASWSVVGSGLNRVAASEVRIKLSELCYRTVSVDALEDKKHIDLSAEALILVCAAGTPAQQVRDIAKEIEIFSAHLNVPVVVADEGMDIAWATPHVIYVPRTHPSLAWLLNTAVGHVFAYHAAREIDRFATPLRGALAALESATDAGRHSLSELPAVREGIGTFLDVVAGRQLRGFLTPDATLSLANAFLLVGPTATATLPMAPGTLEDPFQYLRDQLDASIDQLSRSIDSVKHQAKTVTVGTSRGDSDLLDNSLAMWLRQAGGDPALLSYRVLLGLSALDGVVATVLGATRYRVDLVGPSPYAHVVAKFGSSQSVASRAEGPTPLVGSKRFAADSGMPSLVEGSRDGRIVLIIPEQGSPYPSAITLLHVDLVDYAPAPVVLAALGALGTRLAEIKAEMTELDPTFEPESLTHIPVKVALCDPVARVQEALLVQPAR